MSRSTVGFRQEGIVRNDSEMGWNNRRCLPRTNRPTVNPSSKGVPGLVPPNFINLFRVATRVLMTHVTLKQD
jgi:hypothetical protein